MKLKKNCLFCGKEFSIFPYRKETARYCSKKCQSLNDKGKKFTNEHKLKISQSHKGKLPKNWHLLKNHPLRGFKKGNTPWNKGVTKYDDARIKPLCKIGIKNPQWRGGVTPLHKQIRKSVEYEIWRRSVFERDNYTCVWCNYRGKRLNADHIKPFALYPELRFAIDNGRTLCTDCHKKTDTYGMNIPKLKIHT